MLTLIHGGEVYTPEPIGVQSLLVAGTSILKIGDINADALRALDVSATIINAHGYVVTPGLIDPHEHLIGAGGEQSFASRTTEVTLEELLLAGITTVVGCIGTDTISRQLPALLSKARQLDEQGITAYIYTGGFWVPPKTITGSIMDDLVMIDKVIGAGELAIADSRSPEPTRDDLAQLVSQAIVGGSVSGKGGIIHFHVGSGRRRLELLRALLDEHEIPPRYVYPTHITRSPELMHEAIDFAKRGAFVDIDTVDDDFGKQLRFYRDHDGPLSQLTVSSDAQTPGGSPAKHFRNIVAAVREFDVPLEDVLPIATSNPAAALSFKQKGRLEVGMDADMLVLRKDTLEIVHVIARGRHMVREGQVGADGAEQSNT